MLGYEVEKTLTDSTSLFIEHGAAFNAIAEEEHEEESEGGETETEHGEGANGDGEDGFLNMEIGLKRRSFKSDMHEAIVSLAAAVEVPTGTDRVGAEDHPVLEFAALFLKGFGDLPDSLSLLRPFAAQGDFRWETPLGEGRPVNAIAYNLGLSYDFRTLHEIVDFPRILEPLAFVTEFNFETVANGEARGETESFLTSGFVYDTEKAQVSVGFQIPTHEDELDFIVLPTVVFFYNEIAPALGRNLLP